MVLDLINLDVFIWYVGANRWYTPNPLVIEGPVNFFGIFCIFNLPR